MTQVRRNAYRKRRSSHEMEETCRAPKDLQIFTKPQPTNTIFQHTDQKQQLADQKQQLIENYLQDNLKSIIFL